jgi:hypothetical protein
MSNNLIDLYNNYIYERYKEQRKEHKLKLKKPSEDFFSNYCR